MSSTLPLLESQTVAVEPVRFHLSLNVDDLSRSVAFFEQVFDRPASKHAADYAKFDLDEPPLVLSLEPCRAPLSGKLNHLGFRVANSESLVAMQRRLELAGVKTTREDGVECCYARQTKFWFNDPDGNMWEIYVVEGDLDHRGLGQKPAAPAAIDSSAPVPSIWAHRLGEAFPPRVFVETGGVDDVLLQGTFNARQSPTAIAGITSEVLRVLKPAGRVTLHQLTAQVPLDRLRSPLPGPAAAVEVVPSAEQISAQLESAGFVDIRFEKLGDGACFMADGVECRETLIVAYKPVPPADGQLQEVLYRGPFEQIVLDGAAVFRRGQWTQVSGAIAQRLKAATYRDQFAIRS